MTDTITLTDVKTLSALFRERVSRMPDAIAYRHYDVGRQQWMDTSWREMSGMVARWQNAMQRCGLAKGDRVAIMLRNSREWVIFDQAALGLGFVTVPLYIEDRAENAAFILRNSNAKLLVVEGREQWQGLLACADSLTALMHIISVEDIAGSTPDPRLRSLSQWLPADAGELQTQAALEDELASIVYTSGTTGRSKGVMLTHRNILFNAWVSACTVDLDRTAVFLSFLPLSHTLERTIGYYLPMIVGGTVAFNRAVKLLSDDLVTIRPTVLISVPRIYERVYSRITETLQTQSRIKRALFRATLAVGWRQFKHAQGEIGWNPLLLLWPLLNLLVARKIMARLGGRIRLAICGGAPLPAGVARFFVSLGLPLLQGYGLTEASPVVSVNRIERNRPESIGLPLPEVEVRIAADGELQTRSPCVMRGYWQDEAATHATFTADGWLRTGDKARMDEAGFIYITGRLKEIIVLSNGEKVPPADMEMAIMLDPLFEQVMVVGESKPYLAALAVMSRDVWREMAREYNVNPDDPAVLRRPEIRERVLQRMSLRLKEFPGYAQIRTLHLDLQPWTVEEGLLTPTLKLKRGSLLKKYAAEIESMYRTNKKI